MTNTESRIAVELEELAAWDDVDASRKDEQQITEADIRELELYGFDSDNQTLVGIGPTERARRANTNTDVADSQRMPPSEPPGPFIAADDDEALPSLPVRKLGPWALAASVVLLAAAAMVVVRGLSPAATPASKLAAAVDGAPATAGLAVKLDGMSVRVFVDGEDRGTPPLQLLGLEPGSHLVSIADPAFAHYSQPVTLTANQVSTIEPVLTFVRGEIQLRAGEGAEEAEVEVIGANERREIHRLPARLEVAPGEYRIRGTRQGYAPFESTAVLSAQSPEVEVKVVLAPEASVGALPAGTELSPSNAPKTAETAGTRVGSLDITSNPPSNVVLDGRPLGKAPRVVQTPPGVHTVVFIHPQHGRLSQSVTVSAGRTTSASADF